MPCAPHREWITGSCGAIDARRSAARPLDVGLELFVGQRAILVDIGGVEILEQSVDFLLQRQPAVTLDVRGPEGVPTGFGQLIGGQVALVLLVAKVESLDGRLPKLLAIESAVTVLVGGLEGRAEIRWHRARLGAVARRSIPQAERIARPPCLAESRGSTGYRSSADDPPASVGLTAGGTEGVLRPAADSHGLLELSAKAAAGLVRADRRDRSRMSAVGVGPRDRLTRRRRFERLLRGLVRQPSIALVKEVAREPTHESAADDARGDRRATTPGRRRDQAAHRRASEPADCRLRAPLDRLAARQYPSRQRDHRDRPQNVSTPEDPGL